MIQNVLQKIKDFIAKMKKPKQKLVKILIPKEYMDPLTRYVDAHNRDKSYASRYAVWSTIEKALPSIPSLGGMTLNTTNATKWYLEYYQNIEGDTQTEVYAKVESKDEEVKPKRRRRRKVAKETVFKNDPPEKAVKEDWDPEPEAVAKPVKRKRRTKAQILADSNEDRVTTDSPGGL